MSVSMVREISSSGSRSGAGPSDAALAIAARAGESWAQEALFRRYAVKLNRLAFRLMGRDRDVDDLVQDTFVNALQSLGRLEDPNAVSSWLSAILVRLAHKLIRRRRMMVRLGFSRNALDIDFEEIASACTSQARLSELRRIYEVLAGLPADVRVPLVLHRVEGLELAEIASMTKMSLSTVKRRIRDGDAQLRMHAGEDEEVAP